jgi:hypothetical protein
MRKLAYFAAAAAAIVAAPAAAQLGTGLGAGVGANVGTGVQVDTARTLGGVVDTVDRTANRTVDAADRAATRTINGTNLTLVTSNQVTAGTEVRDSRGQRIGTVSGIDGNAAVVVSGQRTYHVPLAQLYRRTSGTARYLVTSIPRAQLTGHVNAQANANSAVHAGH